MFRFSEFDFKKFKHPSTMTKALPSTMVIDLIKDWNEAYESGWRPNAYIVGLPEAQYDFNKRLLERYNELRRGDA